jgi:hypothetical protein
MSTHTRTHTHTQTHTHTHTRTHTHTHTHTHTSQVLETQQKGQEQSRSLQLCLADCRRVDSAFSWVPCPTASPTTLAHHDAEWSSSEDIFLTHSTLSITGVVSAILRTSTLVRAAVSWWISTRMRPSGLRTSVLVVGQRTKSVK